MKELTEDMNQVLKKYVGHDYMSMYHNIKSVGRLDKFIKDLQDLRNHYYDTIDGETKGCKYKNE